MLVPEDGFQINGNRRWLEIAKAEIIPVVQTVVATKVGSNLRLFLPIDQKRTAFCFWKRSVVHRVGHASPVGRWSAFLGAAAAVAPPPLCLGATGCWAVRWFVRLCRREKVRPHCSHAKGLGWSLRQRLIKAHIPRNSSWHVGHCKGSCICF